MKHRDVDRESLAAAAGVAVSAIGDMLNSDRRPYADQVMAFARKLDVPVAWLVDESIEPTWPPATGLQLRPESVLASVVDALGMSPTEAAAALGCPPLKPRGEIRHIATRRLSGAHGDPTGAEPIDPPPSPSGRVKRRR